MAKKDKGLRIPIDENDCVGRWSKLDSSAPNCKLALGRTPGGPIALEKMLDSDLKNNLAALSSRGGFKIMLPSDCYIGPMHPDHEEFIQYYKNKGYALTMEVREVISPRTGDVQDHVYELTFRRKK